MSYYTKEQIKAKAIAVMRYKRDSPDDYMRLIITVSMVTGDSPPVVAEKIKRLAEDD